MSNRGVSLAALPTPPSMYTIHGVRGIAIQALVMKLINFVFIFK